MPTHVDDKTFRPLLVTTDESLLDEALRLAALAGVDLEVAPDPLAARPHWTNAPLVIVGVDVAAACARARLPRRRDVILVNATVPAASAAPVPPGAGPNNPVASHAGLTGGEQLGVAPLAVAPAGTTAAGAPTEAIWALATELGADQVIVLPDAETWLVRRLTESTRTGAVGQVVAVAPGSGGAGASILAAGLAITAVREGARPMLIDADPGGGGLDVLLGWEERAGLRWPDLHDAGGAMSVDGLYAALPQQGSLVLLSWDRSDNSDVPSHAIDAVLDAGRRGSDLVIVDLPRRCDDMAVRALQASDLALLVVRPDVRGCAAAARAAELLKRHCSSVEAVVRGPAPGKLRARDVCHTLGVPLAASLRPESGLPASLDRGEAPAANGRGPLAVLCRRLLERLHVSARDVA